MAAALEAFYDADTEGEYDSAREHFEASKLKREARDASDGR